MKNFKHIIVASALALCSGIANATLIGTIEMTGTVFLKDINGDTPATAADAVELDFFNDFFFVTTATDDFDVAGSTAGSVGSITDIVFDPFAGPVNPFWTVGIFDFSLESVNRLTSTDPGIFLSLEGTGTIYRNDADDTAGTWSLTADTSGTAAFGWSTTTSNAIGVPEPGVLALISLGLIGVGLRRKLS